MSRFEWTDDRVSFMRDASEQSNYYSKAADYVVDALGGADAVSSMHICDVGCGLGYLALALSRRCCQVTAVDIAARPLDVLRENLALKCCGNITVWEGDAFELPDSMQFDAMVFCLFGSVAEAVRAAKGHTRQIVMLRRNQAARRFSIKEEQTHGDLLEADNAFLQSLPAPSFARDICLELNQPIRSMEEAKRFFSLYARCHDQKTVEADEVRRHLVLSGNPMFPYTIPASRELTILSISQ